MPGIYPLRLFLDSLAAVLLLFTLAYWWQGNLAHEIAGTVMFLLLILHNIFNRRWYGGAVRSRGHHRTRVNVGVTALLFTTMVALFVTSVLISKSLAQMLPSWGGFTVRQIHVLAGYWALVVVGVHLGLRWPLLMGLARNKLGLASPSVARKLVLRLVAGVVAVHGLWSAQMLGVADRLSMRMTLDWWNFEESVAPFFIHCLAVLGLAIIVTHYGMAVYQHLAKPRGRTMA